MADFINGTPLTGASRTILGPLTTTFTPAPACTELIANPSFSTFDVADLWAAQTCFKSGTKSGLKDNVDCWPPRTAGVSTPGPPVSAWGFYSPGLACPAGYSAACSATGAGGSNTWPVGGGPNWPVQFNLLSEETAVGCCPTLVAMHTWL
jgi:hypothetical protein